MGQQILIGTYSTTSIKCIRFIDGSKSHSCIQLFVEINYFLPNRHTRLHKTANIDFLSCRGILMFIKNK